MGFEIIYYEGGKGIENGFLCGIRGNRQKCNEFECEVEECSHQIPYIKDISGEHIVQDGDCIVIYSKGMMHIGSKNVELVTIIEELRKSFEEDMRRIIKDFATGREPRACKVCDLDCKMNCGKDYCINLMKEVYNG